MEQLSTNQNSCVANQASNNRAKTIGINNGSSEFNTVMVAEVRKKSSEAESVQNRHSEKRRMKRVPLLLLRDKKNKQYYYPQVASFGPYHHGEEKLKLVEDLKPKVMQCIVSDCQEINRDYFYNKVLEVIKDARSCYVEGSTDAYNDEEFAQMMLLDGCLILCAIDCTINNSAGAYAILYYHLDALTVNTLVSDMHLLENQIPFQVLELLMGLKFGSKKGKEIINAYIVLVSEGVISNTFMNKKEFIVEAVHEEEENQSPIHLLDALRIRKLSKRCEDKPLLSLRSSLWDSWRKKSNINLDLKTLHHSFRSAMELKAKGIFVKSTNTDYLNDIKFKSYWFYGQLELPILMINSRSKSEFLNFMAHEVCLNDLSELKITSYLAFMRSLIDHPDDVKEMRSRRVILTVTKSDEEVVKIFKEMDIYDAIYFITYVKLRDSIQKHYNSKARTWMAELYSTYFSSPWKTITLLGGTFLLVSTILQTYFSWEALQRM